MKYTKENGQYYKVIEDGKVILKGQLINDWDQLDTNSEVIFITEEEYKVLTNDTEQS